MSDGGDEPPTGLRSLRLEADQYMHHLDDTDLTEEEKTAFLEALWLLIVELMSDEFGTHPAQQALAARKGKAANRPRAEQGTKRR